MIRITTDSAVSLEVDWLVLLSGAHESLPADLRQTDQQLNGKLGSIWSRNEFAGDYCKTLSLRQLTEISPVNLLLAGIGQTEELSAERLRRSLLTALRKINKQPGLRIGVRFADHVAVGWSASTLIELAADCATVAVVDAGVHKQKPSRFDFKEVHIAVDQPPVDADEHVKSGRTIGSAVSGTRCLVNYSAYQMTPERMVEEARELANQCDLEFQVLDAADLARENMNAMLAVAQGSDRTPSLVRLSWRGNPTSSDEIGLAGKGVTFDSGGLSIKPTESMVAMKSDMAGAATVMEAVGAAASLRLPVNVTAWLGLVENMISGQSYRPGDVVTARTGTTIEVQNTDAEGRLVLADVLSYAIDHGTTHLIDLATLTGACVVALGEEITGMFGGCDELSGRIEQAATNTGEYVWPMPMHAHFDELLKSDVADCRNVGPRWGGAVTAACFLRKFVGTTPWVHLDIAGPSWANTSAAWCDSGGTGAMVRTLIQLLRQWPVQSQPARH
ncbi:MAG: leucyl aminopeptidase [Fuerstiella sp.]|nr:leucyl aminopeptidase [Fuerstiella sp.]